MSDSNLQIEKVENGWVVYLRGKDPFLKDEVHVFTDSDLLGEFVSEWAWSGSEDE